MPWFEESEVLVLAFSFFLFILFFEFHFLGQYMIACGNRAFRCHYSLMLGIFTLVGLAQKQVGFLTSTVH